MRIAKIYKNLNDLAKSCAGFLYTRIQQVLAEKGEVSILLSGGITQPAFYQYFRRLYRQKQQQSLDIYWFLANERWEAPGSSLHHATCLDELLFEPLKSPGENVFTWPVLELAPRDCGQKMENSLTNFFNVTGKKPDLAFLTMDARGHLDCLYPGARVLQPDGRLAEFSPQIKRGALALHYENDWYMTLSPTLLNQVETVVILVTGEDKKKAFEACLAGRQDLSLGWLKNKNIYYYLTRDAAGDYLYRYGRRREQ